MRRLSVESLTEMLTACHETKGLKIGIAFSSKQRASEFADELMASVSRGSVPTALYLFDKYTMWFESASNIHLFSVGSKSMLGRRYDAILYDDDIKDDDIEGLQRFETGHFHDLSKYLDKIPEDMRRSVELDDFLSTFSVNKTGLSSEGGEETGNKKNSI